MKSWKQRFCLVIGALLVAGGVASAGGEGGTDKGALPKPRDKADVDLLTALKGRHSTRSFDSQKPIPDDVLATILWAADGVNRADGKHTAPTANDVRHMRLFVCRADGAYRYDQDALTLLPVSDKDLRASIGKQKFMADAPVVLLLASDLTAFAEKAPKTEIAQRREWSQMAAGCIAQNVYLAAAAFGLGTVSAASLNEDVARQGLKLKDTEVPLYLMPLGYPKAQ